MKNFTIFILFNVLFSYVINYEASNILNDSLSSSCQNKCLTCQQTIYNLKFNNKAGCANTQCESTVTDYFILKTNFK